MRWSTNKFCSLPRIQQQVQQKADYVDTELKSLPEAVEGNLPAVVTEELGNFKHQLQKHIDGGSQMCPFQKDFHELAMHFRQELLTTKPILRLRDGGVNPRVLPTRETPNGSMAGTPTPTPTHGIHDNRTPIHISDDEEALSPTLQRQGNKRANKAPLDTPRKVQRTENVCAQSPATQKIMSKCFTLMEIRTIIHRGYISLPGQLDPKAVEELIRLSMLHWQTPLEHFFASLKSLCQNTVMEQLQDVFGHRSQTQYFDTILDTCKTFLEKAIEDQLQLAQRILDWEMAKPKTLNEGAMEQARVAATELLKSQRRKVLAEPFLEDQEGKGCVKKLTGPQREERLAKVPDHELVQETFGP